MVFGHLASDILLSFCDRITKQRSLDDARIYSLYI